MNLPCMITSIRILATVIMLFLNPLSPSFYFTYTISGITDVADGYVARKTKQVSEFGARLDSIADIIFYSVMVFKLFSILWKKIPAVIWCIAFTTVAVRLVSYALAAIKYKRFASLHTYMNKFTGFLFFLIPYTIKSGFFIAFAVLTCCVGTIATVEELVIHIKSKDYDSSVKTLLHRA